MILRRICNLTGLAPVLAESGGTFEQVAEARGVLTGLLNETFTTNTGLELPIIQLAVDCG